MKLKYYMRGLGIGIVVTAILMGIALPTQKESLSDEEIRQRALAMGMIEENGVLADDLGKADEDESAIEEISENSVSENGETAEEAEAAEAKMAADKALEAKTQEDNTEDSAIEETVKVIGNDTAEVSNPQTAHTDAVITIQSGDGSRTASYKLQGAGVIDDIAEFDSFLCKNGYDKKLVTGDHEIKAGDTWEEIAKELTRRKH